MPINTPTKINTGRLERTGAVAPGLAVAIHVRSSRCGCGCPLSLHWPSA